MEPENKNSRTASRGDQIRLIAMLFLTFTYFLVEITVGYKTKSVALVADSFHMLSDVIALVIAFVSIRMSPKTWSKNTFGWARAEVLGALVNAVFLVALCFSILVESIQRFITKVEIEEPELVLIVGGVGLLINLLGLGLFHDHGHSHGGGGHHGHSHFNPKSHSVKKCEENLQNTANEKQCCHTNLDATGLRETDQKSCTMDMEQNVVNPDDLQASDDKSGSDQTASASQMNMHGVFLHVLADAVGSVVVIISALIVWLTNWEYKVYVDPTLSVLLVILILCSVWPLLVQSSLVLLQTVPTHIQIDDLKLRLLATVPEAIEIHEFHVWQLAGSRIIASAHILCSNQTEYMKIGEQIKEFFHKEGIHSTTIQLEFGQPEDDDLKDGLRIFESSDCFLTCPSDKGADCSANSCCGVQKRKSAMKVKDNLAFVSESSSNISSHVT